MLEKSIESYLVRKCRNSDMLCIKLIPDYMAGLPDRMVLHKGQCIFVELKAPGKVSRPIQVHVQKLLRLHGFRVEEIDSREKVDLFVKDVAQ